jgi:hypothetical protein
VIDADESARELLRMWFLLEIGDGTSVHVVSCAEITSL